MLDRFCGVAFACLLLACMGFSTKPDAGKGTLKIIFEPMFGARPLVLEKQMYHSANGDSLYIELLRFYISSIQLQGKNGAFNETSSYHLIDAEESASMNVVLKNVPAARYKTLIMNVGTDSLANVSGALGGDLDPTQGMYWAWNSGYINVKIEGRSNSCNTLHHGFEFHIGGYLPPNQTVRNVVLPLNQLKIKENGVTELHIKVDLAKFFNRIQLSKTNQMMIPGKQAAKMANCFVNVFSI
ncbi:MAG: MbnP family protein [Bacteroidota bacterium]